MSGNGGKCMIAATASGSGKTVITCGIIEALKRRGLDVVSFKCGPDYIDPMFHRTVLGIESLNLDTYLAGIDGVKKLVYKTLSDLPGKKHAVIEGVMGIYDGISPKSFEGSCYEIAAVTNTPIILVVDASGVGRSIISIVKGILADDEKGLIKGIIFNRMSDVFYEKCYPYFCDELKNTSFDVRILGNIPKTDGISLASRHLGLTLPDETEDLKDRIGKIADIIEEKLDVSAMLDVMEKDMPFFCDNAKNASEEKTGKDDKAQICLAVARDEAFCFYYSENIRLFEELGAEIIYFSPVHDRTVPDEADALLIGGGYPELYLKELSSNTSMLESVKNAIENGMPSLAECGGFMYLHDKICDLSGKEYKMAGVIDGTCTYSGHLVNFGYARIISAGAGDDGFLQALSGMRCHEFHYYDSSSSDGDVTLLKESSKKEYTGMIAGADRLWGWPHLYYPSCPEAVRRFLKMAQNGNRLLRAGGRSDATKRGFARRRDPQSGRIPCCGPAKQDNNPTSAQQAPRTLSSASFFSNKACKYYPCHDCDEDINCLFCYCPLYGMDCPGDYKLTEKDGKQIKNCKDCVFPHIAENYKKVIKLLKQ